MMTSGTLRERSIEGACKRSGRSRLLGVSMGKHWLDGAYKKDEEGVWKRKSAERGREGECATGEEANVG